MCKFFLRIFFVLLILTGCVNHNPYSEFVKSINFSSLNTFSYNDTVFTGIEFSDSQKLLLKSLSKEVITSELSSRGFQLETRNRKADFFVQVKWRKAINIYANPADHIDPYGQVLRRHSEKPMRPTSRMHLLVEIYNNNAELFWLRKLPNIFDTLELNEVRVVNSLKLAVRDFPYYVDKDPNLPSLE